MYLLFIETEKGLAASTGGKMYFPDRTSKINREGIYTCGVTHDHKTYAFVDGTEVTTKPINIGVAYAFNEPYLYDESVINLENIYVKRVGNSIVIFSNVRKTWMGFINKDNNLVVIDDPYPYFYNEFRLDNEKDAGIKDIISSLRELDYDLIFRISMECMSCFSSAKISSIKVYDNVVVQCTFKTPIGADYLKVFSGCTKDNQRFIFNESLIWDLLHTNNIQEFKPEYLKSFMVKQHYGFDKFYMNFSNFVSSSIKSILGERIHVHYLNAARALEEPDRESIDIVEDSMKECELMKKRIGKSITKSLYPELKKLSYDEILNLKDRF